MHAATLNIDTIHSRRGTISFILSFEFHTCLVVRNEDQLEEQDEADNNGGGVMKPKASVHVLLVHKVAKQE